MGAKMQGMAQMPRKKKQQAGNTTLKGITRDAFVKIRWVSGEILLVAQHRLIIAEASCYGHRQERSSSASDYVGLLLLSMLLPLLCLYLNLGCCYLCYEGIQQ
mmetsp:Transcript_20646/g.59973  ORF Transcript_20646/g.59973 Transcript_20646/m.59973 type:complete len:103 (+) Transcript_20646:1373-1681(+)